MNRVNHPGRVARGYSQTCPHQGNRRVWGALLWVVCLGASRCGFQPQNTAQLPDALRTLTVQSHDPYGPLARAVHTQLRRHGFIIVEHPEYSTLQLHLLSAQEERALRSVFSNGRGAQYQLIYRVAARLQWPQLPLKKTPLTPQQPNLSDFRQRIPLAVAVTHTFFDNPQTALAKSVEQETVQQQLCQQAADQLALQLLLLLSERGRPDPASRLATTPLVTEDATPEP